MGNNVLLRLRLQRGLTQEELSEQSGISVRTIRNFERGLIQRPRRSSVDMLLAVLDPDLRERLRSTPVDENGLPRGLGGEWQPLVDPGRPTWRGSRPARTCLVGRDIEVDRLGEMVTNQQVVVVTGPGGVGKSRVALATAEAVGRQFADGVAVAEMGRIPRELYPGVDAALELAWAAVDDLIGPSSPSPGSRSLLVLDNVEHLTRTMSLLVQRLLTDHSALHVLITSRRPPVLPGAGIWELAPLDDGSAVELLLDRVRTGCPGLDLDGERRQVFQLVRQLDGLPRFIEFAAYRLRTVPLSVLLGQSHSMNLLGSADAGALPHQRTLAASLQWSLDLLEERHQRLLAQLASQQQAGVPFSAGELEFADGEAVELLADLADASLVQVVRGHRYEYRLLRHVQTMLSGMLERQWAVSVA
jgi:predicted ATPase/transcriptional regulator with XRE-family HTH domain